MPMNHKKNTLMGSRRLLFFVLQVAWTGTFVEGFVAKPCFGPAIHTRPTGVLEASLLTEVVNGYNSLLDAYPLGTQMVTASVSAGIGDVMAQLRQQQPQQQAAAVSSLGVVEQKQLDLERLGRFMLKGLGGGVIWSFWFALNDQWTTDVLMREFFLQDDYRVNLMTMLLSMGGTADTIASSAMIDPTTALLTDASVSALDDLPTLATAVSLPMSVSIGRAMVSILLEQFIAVPIIYAFWDIPVPVLLSDKADNKSIPSQVQDKLPGMLVDNAKVWTIANFAVYSAPLQYQVLVSSLADIVWQSIVSGHVMTAANNEQQDHQEQVDSNQLPLVERILGETVEGVSSTSVTTTTRMMEGMRTGEVVI